jgi:hypothetical protein
MSGAYGSPSLVRVENAIFCLHYRMVRAPAIDGAPSEETTDTL